MMRRGTEAAVTAGLTALDQATKFAAAHRTIGLIPGVIRLNYTENRGFSLGLFDGAVSVALVLSLIVFAGLLAVLIRLPRDARIRLPLLCIAAGALGNLIDRVFLGYVRDMIELLFIRFYIFNFADICVTLGATCCAVMLLLPGRKETP